MVKGQVEMERILKPARRPLIAMNIVIFPVFIIGILAFIKGGLQVKDSPFLLIPLLIVGFLATVISGSALIVTSDEIVKRSLFLFTKSVKFSEIQRSEVQVIAESDHPAFIAIYEVGQETPALNVILKLYSKDDVKWLCSLSEIKAKYVPQLRA